ncbi:hypothetical protein [Serratia proteamaculans]|uniref:hypothetical protein n=1 Tax=Serratia proteamaculans TaxID=28151 RepID=UPI0021843C60|nr:hypothetical protein [Serratia proteamaculans]CAI2431370.1 Uncharacterised protein [Serratia proteamaculans]
MRQLSNKEITGVSGAYAFGDFSKAIFNNFKTLLENLFTKKEWWDGPFQIPQTNTPGLPIIKK